MATSLAGICRGFRATAKDFPAVNISLRKVCRNGFTSLLALLLVATSTTFIEPSRRSK